MENVKLLIGFDTIIPKHIIVNNRIRYNDSKQWVSLQELQTFKDNIDKTFAEYVYPSIFTGFTPFRVISEQNLYKLRVWANIYRQYKTIKSDEYNRYYLYKLLLKSKMYSSP